jgi:hypothetical protein
MLFKVEICKLIFFPLITCFELYSHDTFFFLVLAVKMARPPAPDELLISPLTGEKIPATKVQEHMRIGLLDPRWVEQRDRQIQDKINQETVYAPGEMFVLVCADGILSAQALK